MFITTLIGFAATLVVGTVIAIFIDEIIDWAKRTMDRISSLIRKSQVWIQRIPGGIKQFLYYVQNGDFKCETQTVPVSEDKIKELKKKMSDKDWKEFTGEGTHLSNVDRDA